MVATLFGRLFPAHSIADARVWAGPLNVWVQKGIDPREALSAEKTRAGMTVARAHELYRIVVHQGRASRAKPPNQPRTIRDKLKIYTLDIAPKLGNIAWPRAN